VKRANYAIGEPQGEVPTEVWSRRLARFKTADDRRAWFELVVTSGAFGGLMAVCFTAQLQGLWPVAVLLTAPAALFLVRLFLIQHDCGHGAFFRSRRSNDLLGHLLGVLTLTPYECWRRTHALHHATSGDLDRRAPGQGAIDMLTVAEYRALPPLKRLGYRLYRHPVVLFGLGPSFVYFLQQRVPAGLMGQGWVPWADTLGNSAAVLLLFGGIYWAFGLGPVLLAGLTVALAATLGVWLFYVQHQFEQTVWTRSGEWKARGAAFHGSSFYDLPGPLPWLTAHVGVHHVHHLSSRIPFYRLPEVLKAHPELRGISRVGLRESFGCARLVLWDEERSRLVSFRDASPPRRS
jgi:acyl-lipid omega-6 desaturase (Delta-12 desaturase)